MDADCAECKRVVDYMAYGPMGDWDEFQCYYGLAVVHEMTFKPHPTSDAVHIAWDVCRAGGEDAVDSVGFDPMPSPACPKDHKVAFVPKRCSSCGVERWRRTEPKADVSELVGEVLRAVRGTVLTPWVLYRRGDDVCRAIVTSLSPMQWLAAVAIDGASLAGSYKDRAMAVATTRGTGARAVLKLTPAPALALPPAPAASEACTAAHLKRARSPTATSTLAVTPAKRACLAHDE